MEMIKAQLADPVKAAKFLLIPALAIVLAWLVFGRGHGNATESGRAAPKNKPSTQVALEVELPRGPERPADFELRAAKPLGPKFDLHQVLQSNPFSLPLELRAIQQTEVVSATTEVASARRPPKERAAAEAAKLQAQEAARLQAQVDALAGKSASIIVSTPRGPVAFMDARAVAVGDYLDEGVRVTEIRPDGIIVEVEAKD